MPTNPDLVNYQNQVAERLRQHYPKNVPVETEWRSKFEPRIYSPRVDVAVGPFATTTGERLIEKYNEMMTESSVFLQRLIDFHLRNTQEEIPPEAIFELLIITNRNARCFLAIEVENSGSRKHLMGDAINAAALGRIGIAIGWTPEKFQAFLNLKRYFEYMRSVGKNTFNLGNLLILNRDQLIEAIATFG